MADRVRRHAVQPSRWRGFAPAAKVGPEATPIPTSGHGPPDLRRIEGAVVRSRLAIIVLLVMLIVDAGAVAAAPAPVISRGPTDSKVIALTFDDGYAPQRCQKIYDTLVEFDIPATWFPNAVYMASAPKLWKKIAARFPIANHTSHHRSLPTLSTKQIREEILSHERRVQSITGRAGQKILRPPFGAYDDRVRRVAGKLGYTSIAMWDVSSADTSPRSGDRAIAERTLSGRPGSIILMHCGPPVTPRILPVVIARYACRGYRFATVDELLAGQPGVQAKVSCPPPPLPERRNASDTTKSKDKKAEDDAAGAYEPAAEQPSISTAAELDGDDVWRLAELRDGDVLQSVPAEVVITLQLLSQGASGTIGCDLYSTSTKSKADGTLKLGRVRRSFEGCEADDQGWVARYLEALSSVTTQDVVDGRLRLLGDDGQVVSIFDPGTPAHVVGEWSAASVADENGELVAVPEGTPIDASFGATGTLRGSTACTRYLSGYATRGAAITIGPLLATEATCAADDGVEPETAAVAEDFIIALRAASAWAIRDGVLELRDADDRIVAELAPLLPGS
jgi:peptidoglycan/xylan/chitin deacetylase (PgdA/CDA1 family)/heat shock protein HslJ